jgi:hypothetical protein
MVGRPGLGWCGFPHLRSRATTLAGAAGSRTVSVMYGLLVFVHILAAIAWFGTGLFHQLHMVRLRSVSGHADVGYQMESMSWTEKGIFIPAPLLVLATGITMVAVNDAWAFSQAWVYLSLGFWVAEAIMGGAVGGKLLGRIQEAREQGGDVSGLIDRDLSIAWVDVAILTVILVLMVFKPGL